MVAKLMEALIFIDTNILLDFYRERKSDVSMKFLEQMIRPAGFKLAIIWLLQSGLVSC